MTPASSPRRVAVASILLLLTAVLSWFALSLRVDPGVESVIPSSGGDLRRLREFNRLFGSDEVILVALHSNHLFTRAGLESIERLTREAGGLPHVARVLSPTNVRDLDGDELGPVTRIPYEEVQAGALAPEELGKRLAAHPQYGGLLVSADARTAAVVLDVERVEGDPAYRGDLVRRVRALADRPGAGVTAYVAGIPVEKADVADSVRREQRIFAPLIFALLMAMMAGLYRHPTGVIVPMSVVALSLIWTLGLYAMAGRALNPIASLMTPVVLVVSVVGSVHLMHYYLAARAEGLACAASLERALALSRVPCLNDAVTTAIGFSSLVLLPIPALRDFGLFTAAGVMIAYFLTMTLAPLLIHSLPDFPPGIAESFRPGSIERSLKTTVSWIGRHPVAASVASVAVLAISVAGIARVRVETDLIRALRPTSPLYRATTFVDDHLTGVNSLEIVVAGVPPDDPEGLRRVDRFAREIRKLPGVRKVTGLPDLFSRVNRAFHAGDGAFEKLPEGPGARDDLNDFRDLLRREAPAELARVLSPDGRRLRLAARVKALDTASSQELFRKIRRAARSAGLPGVELTGNFVMLSNMSTSLVRNQVRGLLPALALILAAMAVQFRSVRLGLLSAIPSGAPILMTYGLMGWAGIPLSVPTAMIACIAIGMTVDNTIHLLARFREGFAQSADYLAALAAMVDSSGRAVVFSTVTVALGFWVGVFSSFLPSVHFAVLTGVALLLGLACQVVLLPLALILFQPLGRAGSGSAAVHHRAALGVLLLSLVVLPVTAARAGAAGKEIILKDQFGNRDGPGLHHGRTVMLLYGRATDLRRMKTWEQRILEKARGKPEFLRAVDARGVRGRKTEAEVNRRLRQNVPPEISVLVDWNGELARAYALPDAEVAAMVLDPRGRACGTVTGPARPESVARALELLTHAMQGGRCP